MKLKQVSWSLVEEVTLGSRVGVSNESIMLVLGLAASVLGRWTCEVVFSSFLTSFLVLSSWLLDEVIRRLTIDIVLNSLGFATLLTLLWLDIALIHTQVMSSVWMVQARGIDGVVRDLGELFLFLLFLEFTLFLFSTLKGFLLSSLQVSLLDSLLNSVWSLNEIDDVHNDVTNDQENKRHHKGNTSTILDFLLWSSIGENKDGNDQGGVKSLIGEHIRIDTWSLVWLASNHVQDVSMGTHQDEDILQEDESTLNWKGQQHGG